MSDVLLLQDAPQTAIIENAPQKAKPWLFSRETAIALGNKGRAVRAARLEALKAEKANPTPKPEPISDELAAVLAEIERVSLVLSDMKLKPADRCALGKTLDMHLDRARIIRGQALPGTATSRAPAPAQSPASSMLSSTAPAQDTRPARDEQE